MPERRANAKFLKQNQVGRPECAQWSMTGRRSRDYVKKGLIGCDEECGYHSE